MFILISITINILFKLNRINIVKLSREIRVSLGQNIAYGLTLSNKRLFLCHLNTNYYLVKKITNYYSDQFGINFGFILTTKNILYIIISWGIN